jgi:hypothetical protein
MVELAPRYDPRILEAARMLDDPRESMAETCRRVGRAAAAAGLPKPSYSHLRRFIRAERARREREARRRQELREIALEVTTRLVAGRFVDPYVVADQVRSAGEK